MRLRRRYGWLLLALALLHPALGWGQSTTQPPTTGDIRITQAAFAALETCRPSMTYQITDAQSGTQVDYWCPPTGLPPLEAKSGNNSAPATTAFGATSDRMVWLAPETVSVSSNFTVEGAINFDVDTTGGGITAQLLTLAASLGGEFHLRIVAGTAPLTLAPAASETINGLSAPVHVRGVRSGMHISRRAGDWEVAFDEPLAVGLPESGASGDFLYLDDGPTMTALTCTSGHGMLSGGAGNAATCTQVKPLNSATHGDFVIVGTGPAEKNLTCAAGQTAVSAGAAADPTCYTPDATWLMAWDSGSGITCTNPGPTTRYISFAGHTSTSTEAIATMDALSARTAKKLYMSIPNNVPAGQTVVATLRSAGGDTGLAASCAAASGECSDTEDVSIAANAAIAVKIDCSGGTTAISVLRVWVQLQ